MFIAIINVQNIINIVFSEMPRKSKRSLAAIARNRVRHQGGDPPADSQESVPAGLGEPSPTLGGKSSCDQSVGDHGLSPTGLGEPSPLAAGKPLNALRLDHPQGSLYIQKDISPQSDSPPCVCTAPTVPSPLTFGVAGQTQPTNSVQRDVGRTKKDQETIYELYTEIQTKPYTESPNKSCDEPQTKPCNEPLSEPFAEGRSKPCAEQRSEPCAEQRNKPDQPQSDLLDLHLCSYVLMVLFWCMVLSFLKTGVCGADLNVMICDFIIIVVVKSNNKVL
ncbi:uncharacterized protein [Argopecten irradians]|uniref:uncharacterized protein isoform X2 n=2 Tax=Argopecten irradians TaxID=31199 RepID=UPI0037139B20